MHTISTAVSTVMHIKYSITPLLVLSPNIELDYMESYSRLPSNAYGYIKLFVHPYPLDIHQVQLQCNAILGLR